MAKIKVPGVYFEEDAKINRDVTLGETGIPAFIGVAERGPLNEPVSVESMSQFLKIYGLPVEDSYLHDAVNGFFSNGGKHCYIVRIAHVFRHGGGELANCARFELLDNSGYPTLEISASSEGSWGNNISVSIDYLEESRVHTFLTLDLPIGAHVATLQSTRGIERGTLLKFRDGETERFVTVESVRGNEIFWHEDLDHLFRSASPTYVESLEFNLYVSDKTRQERFLNLSMSKNAIRNVCRVLEQESQLVRVKMLSSGNDSSCFPEAIQDVILRGGRDGLEGITAEDIIGYNNGPGARFGIGALEPNEIIDLVAIPDLHYCRAHCNGFKSDRDIIGVQIALLNHCERMGDRFAILDIPKGYRPEQVQDYRSKFESSFGALYYPWVWTNNKGKKRLIPPAGHIAGLYARCDREDGVFRAPANIPLADVYDVEISLHEGHLAELNEKGINPIRNIPQRGIRPWGARSLSNDPDWRYLTSRRVFCAVKRAIYENTQWVVFEINGKDLRAQVEKTVTDFLANLWAAGYFPGKTQNAAFFVKCDETNNTAENIEEGSFVVDVGIAIGKPTEFIVMNFEHQIEEPVIES